MTAADGRLARTSLLAGDSMMGLLSECRVIVFGVGGVGSWCVEALARTGFGHITIVDSDAVAESNINRQLPALTSTVGMPKVEVLRKRILDINPDADKADLILRFTDPATAPRRAFFSSMGAARKLDPDRIAVAEFWKVEGCPLARALRTRFRRSGVFPKRKFRCVYSPETLEHRKEGEKGVNGTFAHATAIFGLRLASLAVTDIYSETRPITPLPRK